MFDWVSTLIPQYLLSLNTCKFRRGQRRRLSPLPPKLKLKLRNYHENLPLISILEPPSHDCATKYALAYITVNLPQ